MSRLNDRLRLSFANLVNIFMYVRGFPGRMPWRTTVGSRVQSRKPRAQKAESDSRFGICLQNSIWCHIRRGAYTEYRAYYCKKSINVIVIPGYKHTTLPDVRQSFFNIRVINLWNNLLADTTDTCLRCEPCWEWFPAPNSPECHTTCMSDREYALQNRNQWSEHSVAVINARINSSAVY